MGSYEVGGGIGLICLVLAALFWTPRIGKRHTTRAIVLLELTGIAGLLGTPPGVAMAKAITSGNATIGQWITVWVGVGAVGVPCLVALYMLVMDWVHKKITERTLVAGPVAMLTASTVPGAGVAITSGFGFVTGTIGWAVAYVLHHKWGG
jgi:hypothetical protein